MYMYVHKHVFIVLTPSNLTTLEPSLNFLGMTLFDSISIVHFNNTEQ